MKIFSNIIGDSGDKNNFPIKLLLTNRQTSRLLKAFANSLSANIKLSKAQAGYQEYRTIRKILS